MSAAHLRPLTPASQEALGVVVAQRLIDQMRAGEVTPDYAWLRHAELAAAHGGKSAAVRAFVVEMAKRVACE